MNKTLPLLLLAAAAPAAAISPPAQTQITCPVGGEEFWATMHDSAPEYQICPGNKLVFKTAKYGKFTPDELARYQKIIISKAYRSLPANAGLEDYLPVFAEQSGQYSPAAVGWLYFLAANGNRDMNAAARKRLHAKAFSFLNKAVRDNNTNPRDLHSARYALAGMYRISGDFARAETLLRQLLQQNLDPADRTAAQYVLDSVRLRDRGHILPQFHRPQMP
ncbi:Uncharacterised protein [Kingella potus]|uniref:Tetratricopeptide repeat protein n=1 Tax=Kingella potus TaxID=265175 RepID=A0A377QZM9_9NEIS|nr:hypothetical protein [Kingella potus]STR00826.1 Uncharacterised protein [Kingella potus]